MDDIEQMVESERQAGELDSSGAFTLDRNKAFHKLSAHQLPSPQHWILKLVQAAVTWNNESVEVNRSSHEVSVQFAKACSLEEAEQAFFRVEPAPTKAMDHFQRALRGAAHSGGLTYAPPDSHEGLTWNGERLERTKVVPSTRARLAVTASRPQQEQIAELLRNAAFAAPLRLMVGMEPVDGFSYAVRWTGCPSLREVWAQSPQIPTLHCRESGCQGLFAAISWAQDMENETPVSVLWVLDGIVIEQEALDFTDRVSATVVVSAAGLTTDLSGFRLLLTAERQTRLDLALTALRPALLDVCLPVPPPLPPRSALKSSALLVSGGVLIAGSFLLGFPPLLLIGGFSGLGGLAMRFQGDPARDTVLCQTEALGRLQRAWPDGLRQSPGKSRLPESLPELTSRPPASSCEGRSPKWRRSVSKQSE
ncbi:hypothetical protein JST97_22170 [bacterium]|nr:hypothetical protein [bacterium]